MSANQFFMANTDSANSQQYYSQNTAMWTQPNFEIHNTFEYQCTLDPEVPMRRQSEELPPRMIPREISTPRRKSAESALGYENKQVRRILKKTILARMKKRNSIASCESRISRASQDFTHHEQIPQGDYQPQQQQQQCNGGFAQNQCDVYQGYANDQGHQGQDFGHQFGMPSQQCQGFQDGQEILQQQLQQQPSDVTGTNQGQAGGQERPAEANFDSLIPNADIFQGMAVDDELPEITLTEAFSDFDDNFLICV